MPIVNMHDAKSGLSRLVADIESGAETEIIIARNGKRIARLVPLEQPRKNRLLGIAEGKFELGDNWYEEFQALDEVIQQQLEEKWKRLDLLHDELETRPDAEPVTPGKKSA